MGEAIDRLAKTLASGSRRAALGGLLAGATAALPGTAEAKKKKNKRKRNQTRKKRFQKFQELCREWCALEFGSTGPEFNSCVEQAKEGKGACFSSTAQGPGYFCTQVEPCGELNCCPDIGGGGPVTDGECCATDCQLLNGTLFCFE